MSALYFDIETLKNPDHMLFCPDFDMPEKFDPAAVKLGNAKKKETIQNKLLEAELNWPAYREAAKKKHEENFKDKCALSALTGRIACIQYGNKDSHWIELDKEFYPALNSDEAENYPEVVLMPNEKTIIELFWRLWSEKDFMIGFASEGFDLPFIIQRSWLLGVPVPVNPLEKNNPKHIDLMRVWKGGKWSAPEEIPDSLDNVCKAFGIGNKITGDNGEKIGPKFEKYLIEQPLLALKYAEQDIVMTKKLGAILVPKLG